MNYYHTCPICGDHLDPGESCNCQENEKTAADAANTDDGKVEQGLAGHVSTSNDN